MAKEKPDYFNEEWYVEQKNLNRIDEDIAKGMGVSVEIMSRWKKKLGIREMRVYSGVSIPDYCTQEWYDKQKEIGKTDADIARDELFVSISTFNRWKKKGIVSSDTKNKPKGTYSELAAIANEKKISYRNMMRRIYLGWDPMVAATKPVEFRQAK